MSDTLPPGWAWATVADVCLPVHKTDPRRTPNSQFEYIDISGVESGSGHIVQTKSMQGADAPSRARQVVRAGDVVLSTVRTYQRKVASVPAGLDGSVASTGFSVLRPARDIDSHFMLYQVLSYEFVSHLNRMQTGTSYPAVRDRDVRAMRIRIAPSAEQSRIVTAIEEHFSRLDAAEATLRQTLQRLDTLRSSILADAFHADYEPPNGWRNSRLEDLLEHSIGGLWGSPAGEDEHDVDVIRVTELEDHGTLSMRTAASRSITKRQLSSRLLRVGDLVLEKSGGGPTTPVGRVARFPGHTRDAICTNFMLLMRPNAQLVESGFLHWQLHHRYVSGGTAALNKGSGNIRNLQTKEYLRQSVALPSIHEQVRISSEIEQSFTRARQLDLAVSEALVRLAGLRRSVLAAAFSGRLVPQDPDDEPASVLLERIAASQPAKPIRRRRTA